MQLRFEASVCAAIPVIKVLREALVVNHVHHVLGIVNGTTNFVLTRMEAGAGYADAVAEAQSLGYAEADPSEDVSGADAAAKMAILATIAFGSRVSLSDVVYEGIEAVRPEHLRAAGDFDTVLRLVGSAAWSTERSTSASSRRSSIATTHSPRSRAPSTRSCSEATRSARSHWRTGGRRPRNASAVVADMVSVVGTTGTGFLQNDACWRTLPRAAR